MWPIHASIAILWSFFRIAYHAPLHVAAMPLGDGGVELTRFAADEKEPLAFREVLERPVEHLALHTPGRAAEFHLVAWSSGATGSSLLAAAHAGDVEIWEITRGAAACVARVGSWMVLVNKLAHPAYELWSCRSLRASLVTTIATATLTIRGLAWNPAADMLMVSAPRSPLL